MDRDIHYDVLVIGAGPGGSATAARLAQLGRRVLVAERERFPRFHVGESLLPACHAALQRLGVADRIAEAGYVEKQGATFTFEDGSTGTKIVFAQGWSVDPADTWQVERASFDQELAEFAVECGAELRQATRVADVELGESHVTVELVSQDGARETVRASQLVDASGQSGFLAKRLGLRKMHEGLRNVAMFGHFEGVAWPEDVPPGDIQVLSRGDLGWIWMIPLSPTRTSVGLVMPDRELRERRRQTDGDDGERLLALLGETPVARRQLEGARLMSSVHTAADFSYRCEAYCGPRWFLVGDAGSFLDPVFSTGVTLALESGLEAAEAIDRILEAPRAAARVRRRYDRVQARRYGYFEQWVEGFYDPAFRDLFCQPSERFRIVPAIATVLAGQSRPTFAVRWRLWLFRRLVALQRRRPFMSSLHRRSASARA